jgi:ribonucleoside-diphosphate reductase subunit M1
MNVIKRNGLFEPMKFDKISIRMEKLSYGLHNVDPTIVTQKVCQLIYSGIKTSELDESVANICMSMITDIPDYGILASRIVVSNHHKNTKKGLLETYTPLYENKDTSGNDAPLVSYNFFEFIKKYGKILDTELDFERDYLIDYFGLKTLQNGYLLKTSDGIIHERPQHLFMRVAIGLYGNMNNILNNILNNIENDIENDIENELEEIKQVYHDMSLKKYTHASPTLFNIGSMKQSLASCFLMNVDDNLEGIMSSITDCAFLSKHAGGIGISLSKIRSNGSYISGTGGNSTGIIPLLKTYNSIARYINQGGRRLGSFAVYLEPHHGDIFDFLYAKRNQGVEEQRARDLFYGLWISDYFMECVQNNMDWYLMDPNISKGLTDIYGEEYKTLYLKYINEGKFVKQIKARDVFKEIINSQIETGQPYMLYKDSVNRKNNQSNLGTVTNSNLCCEITIYSNNTSDTGTCVLASICLPSCLTKPKLEPDMEIRFYGKKDCVYCDLLKGFLKQYNLPWKEITDFKDDTITSYPSVYLVNIVNGNSCYIGGYMDTLREFGSYIDFTELGRVVRNLVRNLNRIIDINYFPTPNSQYSSRRTRAIGIGIQGLADIFAIMKIPFDSIEASIVNKQIFETIEYYALKASLELAIETKKPYETFIDSPLSKGLFQHNLWGLNDTDLSGLYDWDKLRKGIMKHGVKNSFVTALMPTASTSQIMGNFESFEPCTSNIYTRKTLAGNFPIVNRYLIQDLISIGLWNEEIKDNIIFNRGSVQKIKKLPQFLKDVYKTVWEIDQKKLIKLSADRAPFVCQTQSLNLYLENPTFNQLLNIHFYGWNLGLKTGSYYIRTKPAAPPQRFGMDIIKEKELQQREKEEKEVEEEQGCTSCSA